MQKRASHTRCSMYILNVPLGFHVTLKAGETKLFSTRPYRQSNETRRGGGEEGEEGHTLEAARRGGNGDVTKIEMDNKRER